MAKFQLSIHRCPIHKEFLMISLDERDDDGNGTGTRLTPFKCCGQWEPVKEWPLTKKQLAEIGHTFLNCEEDADE